MQRKISRGIQFLFCTIGLFLVAFLINAGDVTVDALTGLSGYVYKNSFPVVEYITTMKGSNEGYGMASYLGDQYPLMEYVRNQDTYAADVISNVTEDQEELIKTENGVVSGETSTSEQSLGPISYIFGEIYEEKGLGQDNSDSSVTEAAADVAKNALEIAQNKIRTVKETKDVEYLINHFFIVDSTTSVNHKIFNISKMLERDFTINKNNSVPQILIYHTHGASESFQGSNESEEEGIIGVGSYLAELLTNQYGYQVIHEKRKYDWIDGKIDRNRAYSAALPAVRQILADNPSIEVVIDLHRDGVGNEVFTSANVNGKKAAQIMFFNGMSRNKSGEIEYLNNPNRRDNLSFSLQLKIAAMQKYPDLTKPIYLKGYRYNMHLAPRALLIELGNQNNTLEEALNAVPPLAEVIDEVLSKK